jgi:hypothetical protein
VYTLLISDGKIGTIQFISCKSGCLIHRYLCRMNCCSATISQYYSLLSYNLDWRRESSTSLRRSILPAADLGIASMKATFRIFLYDATCPKKFHHTIGSTLCLRHQYYDHRIVKLLMLWDGSGDLNSISNLPPAWSCKGIEEYNIHLLAQQQTS